MEHELSGLVAVVTGGASGIGAATADRLAAVGASVAVLDLNRGASRRHLYVETDVSDSTSVQTSIGVVVAEFGGIDILVNNAGIGAQGDVAANHDDEWHRVWDINVVGMARVTRSALPYLRRSASACVVNVASLVAVTGLPDRVLYSATKGAVLAMTRAMAADHLNEGIRVNAVNPGTTETPWITGLLERSDDPEEELRALEARQPHGRLVLPDEVAAAIVYLASPSAGSTTGTSVAVDGGMQSLRLKSAHTHTSRAGDGDEG